MLLNALKALAESTRLTMVAVLRRGELTVSELAQVLGQSQPRVSRHLRLLIEAGLLERHREGAHALISLARDGLGAELANGVLPLVDESAPECARALERLKALQSERAREAAAYFERVASEWDDFSGRTVHEAMVESRLVELLEAHPAEDLLDLGTGTGRMLELAAPYFTHGLGIDRSSEMLRVARAKLQRAELAHCHVRKGDVYSLNLPSGTADVAVLHHVLHFLDNPALAISEAARTLRPDGHLIVVDFAPYSAQTLQVQHAHRRLGFTDAEIVEWCEQAGLQSVSVEHLGEDEAMNDHALTISIWCARQRSDAPSHRRLEVA